jgi:AraC family transcriptional regulator of adaptative response / DNA-3-methyladenine glycosylase II
VLRLAYRPPYHWAQVRDFLAERAIPGVEMVEKQTYSRTVSTPNGWAIIRVRPSEEVDALEFRVSGADPADLLHLSTVARRVFDLAADPETIVLAFKDDPLLGPLLRQRPGLRIPGVWSPFECAVRAVVGQQVNIRVSRTFLARLVERAGRAVSGPISALTHMFPTPADLIAADLSGLDLTSNRIATLKQLSAAMIERKLEFATTAEEVIRILAQIPGIGPWSAQYVALRALGEPDAFPAADLVLRRTASQANGLITISAFEKRAEAWRPWRAYAAIHLWSAAGKVHAKKPAA